MEQINDVIFTDSEFKIIKKAAKSYRMDFAQIGVRFDTDGNKYKIRLFNINGAFMLLGIIRNKINELQTVFFDGGMLDSLDTIREKLISLCRLCDEVEKLNSSIWIEKLCTLERYQYN